MQRLRLRIRLHRQQRLGDQVLGRRDARSIRLRRKRGATVDVTGGNGGLKHIKAVKTKENGGERVVKPAKMLS